MDDLARVDLALAPFHRQPAAGEVEARVDDAGQAQQSAFDLADAAGACDALDHEVEMRLAAVALDIDREVDRLGHRLPQRTNMRLVERNCRSPSRDSSMTSIHWPATGAVFPWNFPAPTSNKGTTWSRRRSVGCARRAEACRPASGLSAASCADTSTRVAS